MLIVFMPRHVVPGSVRAKSLLKSGRKSTKWKPRKGLVRLSKSRQKLFQRLKLISGHTELRLIPGLPNGNRLLAKLEFQNKPTGSHYDRVYPHLLEVMERTGVTPEKCILAETSSGNATPAFGYFAGQLGYETVAFLPAELSDRRKALTRKQCDRVVIADSKKHGWGVFGAANAMREALLKNREETRRDPTKKMLLSVNHSQVTETLEAIKSLADEAVRELHGTHPDYFLGIAGNGTILHGVGSELKKQFPKMKVIGIEPFERPSIHLLKFPGRYKQDYGREPPTIESMRGKEFFAPGTGALGVDFPHLQSAVRTCDDVVLVRRPEMEKALVELQKKGYNVGHTSAMSYAVAKKVARKVHDKSILTIFYDQLNRY